MINPDNYNTPGYSTRVSPTAVTIFEYQGELYTILVKNQGSTKGYLRPNGKQESHDLDSIQAALREFGEETGIKISPKHIGPLGILYRQAGTSPYNDTEALQLSMKPQGHKYLFLKQQIYELLCLSSIDNLDTLRDETIQHSHDSEDVIIIPLSQIGDYIQICSDLTVGSILIKCQDLIRKIISDTSQDLNIVQQEIIQHADTIFH